MKCPNCNNENEANSKFCIHCGNPLPQEETTVQQEQNNEDVSNEVATEPQIEEQVVVENNPVQEVTKETVTQTQVEQQAQQYTVAPNSTSTQGAQKKQRRSLITILLAGILVIILVVIGVVLLTGGSQKLYKKAIKDGIKEAFENESFDAKSAKATTNLEFSSTDSSYEMLNGLKVDADVQFDLENEQALVKLNIDQNSDSYLALNLFGDLKTEMAYVEEKNLFSKIVGIDIPEEVMDQINEVIDLENLESKDTSKERKVMSDALISALNDNLDKSYFSKNKVTVQIDGKDKKVKDNILTLKESELKAFLTNFATSLKENEEFIKSYETCFGEKDALIGLLDEILDTASDLDDEDTSEQPAQIQIHYYTSGIFNKFIGIGAIAISEDAYDSYAMEIMQSAKNEYTLGVSQESKYGSKSEVSFVVKVNKFEKNNIDIEADLANVGIPMVIKLKTTSEYNKGIDTFDVKNAINVEDLTEDDYEEIMENLENSPLYTFINLISNYVDTDELLEGAGDIIDDEDYNNDDDYVLPSNIKLESNQNFVTTYGDDIVIFNVPSNFNESEYSDSYFRYYLKESGYNTSAVSMGLYYTTPTEYLDSVIENMDYIYEDTEFYHNVKVSDVETVTISGIKYSKMKVEYEYGYTAGNYLKSIETYYLTQINDKMCYIVCVSDDYGMITDNEVSEFLKIDVK